VLQLTFKKLSILALVCVRRLKKNLVIAEQKLNDQLKSPELKTRATKMFEPYVAKGEPLAQTAVAKLPPWFPEKKNIHRYVDTFVLISLFLLGKAGSDLLVSYYTALVDQKDDPLGIGKLSSLTYGQLLPRCYIRLAQVMLSPLQNTLNDLVSPLQNAPGAYVTDYQVDMGPVKDISRITVKMDVCASQGDKNEPMARYILDYLRATVLCPDLEGVFKSCGTITKKTRV